MFELAQAPACLADIPLGVLFRQSHHAWRARAWPCLAQLFERHTLGVFTGAMNIYYYIHCVQDCMKDMKDEGSRDCLLTTTPSIILFATWCVRAAER